MSVYNPHTLVQRGMVDIMPRMAKKEPTSPMPIRLQPKFIKELDAVAKEEGESRAGMAARLVIEGLKRRRSLAK